VATQRGRLRGGQRVAVADHRGQQVEQGREGELRLGLDPAGAQHGDVAVAPLHQRVQQGGLADPGLAPERERASMAGPQVREEAVELGELSNPTNDHRAKYPRTGDPALGAGCRLRSRVSPGASAPAPRRQCCRVYQRDQWPLLLMQG
jgi:hypothetical protein